MKERVLVIAPHPDDEIIGCGGTMAQHVEKGDRIFVIYVTSGELFEDEMNNTSASISLTSKELRT